MSSSTTGLSQEREIAENEKEKHLTQCNTDFVLFVVLLPITDGETVAPKTKRKRKMKGGKRRNQ